jgi:hypothetical protein
MKSTKKWQKGDHDANGMLAHFGNTLPADVQCFVSACETNFQMLAAGEYNAELMRHHGFTREMVDERRRWLADELLKEMKAAIITKNGDVFRWIARVVEERHAQADPLRKLLLAFANTGKAATMTVEELAEQAGKVIHRYPDIAQLRRMLKELGIEHREGPIGRPRVAKKKARRGKSD